MNSIVERYPRTLYEWLKSDDKSLLKAIAAGQSVLEAAEDLQREHFTVLNRIAALDLFNYAEMTEEWAEFMGLSLAGVPLAAVIAWCNAAPERLPVDDIEAMAMGDLRAEFALARELCITVANSDAVGDLSWLLTQPPSVQAGYPAACVRIQERFDFVTPMTLRNQVLGLTPAQPVRQWVGATTTTTNSKPRKHRSDASSSGRTYYRRKRTSTSGSSRRSYSK
jgi:hypothetical protein